tara:strand:+ start:152 stop:505 length:354 start_codon:yes stop_codon:yes gene_type:complete
MELVFVYGTLRKGHGNHKLIEGGRFMGSGLTVKKYAMYSRGIPFVSEDEPVSRIKGEVYEVSKPMLRLLDMLEGHPAWYERKKTIVKIGQKKVKAWLYFNNTKTENLIVSGDYEEAY